MIHQESKDQCVIVQKQRSRTYNGTTYFRYRITIPAHIAEQLHLKGGERVGVSLIRGAIVIRKL
ncbi:MAG: AbrB/MazE/SpoVT family DNA-binding domain-containing protein [Nitrosotalea sp.]